VLVHWTAHTSSTATGRRSAISGRSGSGRAPRPGSLAAWCMISGAVASSTWSIAVTTHTPWWRFRGIAHRRCCAAITSSTSTTCGGRLRRRALIVQSRWRP